MLELRNINKKYKIRNNNERIVFVDTCIKINKGEVVAVLGESGSGKSTLLNLIAGFDKPNSGKILFNEKEISKYKKNWNRNITTLIFQEYNLIDHLTVYENIELALNQFKVKKKKEKIENLLIKLKLENLRNTKAKLLSGGEKQRVAIARSLIVEPSIILADEPTGSLDEENKKTITQMLLDLKSEDKIVIIVTHSKDLAKKCDRILKIENNNIIELESNTKIRKTKIKEETKLISRKFIPLKLPFKNYWQKKLRMSLVALGTSIGLTSMLLIYGIGMGVSDDLLKQARDLIRPNVLEVYNFSGSKEEAHDNEITYEQITKIKNMKEVENVITNYRLDLSLVNRKDELGYNLSLVRYIKIMQEDKYNIDFDYSKRIVVGKLPTNKYEIAVNRIDLKQYLNDQGISATDENVLDLVGKELLFQVEMTDFFNLPENYYEGTADLSNKELWQVKLKLVGIAEIDFVRDDGFASFITKEFADEALQKIKMDKVSTDKLTVFLKDEKDVNEVTNALEKMGLVGLRQEEFISQANQLVTEITKLLLGICFIALIVSSLMISIIVYINLLERRKEIAILHSIGYSKRNIKNIFIY